MTKLTLEIKYPAFGDKQDETLKYSVESDVWDMRLADMFCLFTGLLRNAGYHVGDIGEIVDE
jgi:hypothetical protein